MFVKIAKKGTERRVNRPAYWKGPGYFYTESEYDYAVVNTNNISFIDCSNGRIYMNDNRVIESAFAIDDGDLEEWGLIKGE